jgi:hypothetical protein
MNGKRAIWLSKSKLTAFRQCGRRLWLEVHRPDLRADDPATQRAFAAGNQVGDLARGEHPQGILIRRDAGLAQALRDTQAALGVLPRRPVFEATVRHGGVLVMADLLLPGRDGWQLVEVKSSTAVKEYHQEDVAIQAWVLRGARMAVPRMALQHVDSRFVYPGGGDYRGLFASVDLREAVEPLLPEVPHWVDAARTVLAGPEPDIAMGSQCTEPFSCPFIGHCTEQAGPQPAYPVTLLPNASGSRLAQALTAEGFTDLEQVPADRVPPGTLQRIHAATVCGEAFLDAKTARREMAAAGYPRFYLDFETISFAVPIWEGTRPYQQVPFQWSCHIERSPGCLEHAQFLDLSGADPSAACARELLALLGERGSIIAYNAGFEKSVLKNLAERLPGLARPLEDLLTRFFDPLPVARASYYHRDMRGSWSIKAVLPTIAPDLTYDDGPGAVSDGIAAQGAFLEAIAADTAPERRERIAHELRRYCTRDTWGMVVLAWFLEGRGRPAETHGA